MRKNLEARLAKLEEAKSGGELPNGGLLPVVVLDGEAPELAMGRALSYAPFSSLGAAQLRRLVPIFLTPADAPA